MGGKTGQAGKETLGQALLIQIYTYRNKSNGTQQNASRKSYYSEKHFTINEQDILPQALIYLSKNFTE